MSGHQGGRIYAVAGLLALLALSAEDAWAGGNRFARRTQVGVRGVPTGGVTPSPRVVEPLGSFYATPYIMVRGNAPAGGGYSPLGQYGDATMALYGPLSPLRMSSAPVLTYSRGYNGQPVVTPGTSFSAPNLPRLTPVVYPTQASSFYGFRQSGNPPWWANAINWIDQN